MAKLPTQPIGGILAKQANFAHWDLFFAEPGRYRVEAYTAHAYATSRRAAYVVQAAGTSSIIVIDQAAVDGWQALGELEFAARGSNGSTSRTTPASRSPTTPSWCSTRSG